MLPSPSARTKLLLFPALVCLPILASACVFGGKTEEAPTAAPTSTSVARPAISRSGPEPTSTPVGGSPRPTAVPPTPAPARSPVEGLVSVVYSFPFIWPAEGPITSFMSPEHPNGIDIGLDDSSTKEVRAAAGGAVTHAGGDDDEALGISIVIDHGNDVTTVYGHLSELRVEEGDTVEIGEVIGIGGSTGISTGEHLHFEVRKAGETVDPLHVLPVEDGDTTALDIDCSTTPFTLPSGSQALLDFGGVLRSGEEVVSVSAVPLNGGPSLEYEVDGGGEVRLSTAIDFDGPNGLDSYDLEVTVDSPSANEVLTCGFVVQRRNVPTTFYVRAFPPASDLETPAGEDEDMAAAEPEPTPEPTANPWAASPNYGIPTPVSGTGQGPTYSAPGTGAGGVQSPNYGFPNASPTP